jgi:hypothetical protein
MEGISAEQEMAVKIAEEALKIMKERNNQYKSPNEKNLYATIMMLFFPSGIPSDLKGIMRYKYISYIVDKLVRYVINIIRGGHEDSLIDISNYSLMLAAFDRLERMKETEREKR